MLFKKFVPFGNLYIMIVNEIYQYSFSISIKNNKTNQNLLFNSRAEKEHKYIYQYYHKTVSNMAPITKPIKTFALNTSYLVAQTIS